MFHHYKISRDGGTSDSQANPSIGPNRIGRRQRRESQMKGAPGPSLAWSWWMGSDWAELVADCSCEDCRPQRAGTANENRDV